MITRAIAVSAIITISLISWQAPADAAWPADGIQVCGETGEQTNPKAISDGTGGMIVAWQDARTGTEIYAQRLDGSGAPVWTAGGIEITQGVFGYIEGLVTDGAGGAIIVWTGFGPERLYATRVGPAGTFPWGAGGALINSVGPPENVVAAADGSGGVLAVWTCGGDPYIQRLNAGGAEMWTSDGVQYSVFSLPGDYSPDLISDGAGGALIAYWNGGMDVYLQRVYANGTLWNSAGTQVDYTSGLGYLSYDPAVSLDGTGGAYYAWRRNDPGTVILVQRINAAGGRLFTSPETVCLASGTHQNPDIIGDGVGGACVVWENDRGSGWNIYAQRLDAFGDALWETDGIPLGAAGIHQYDPVAVSSGPSGFIAAWTGIPVGGPGYENPLYVQKIDNGGTVLWAADGLITLDGDIASGYDFAADGSGGIVTVINKDKSLGTDSDIYAQSINAFGEPAAPEPEIIVIEDVPGDQGGWLRITIGRSDRDHLGQVSERVTFYDIWQRVDDPPAFSPISDESDGGSGPVEYAAIGYATGEDGNITLFEQGSRRFITAAPGGAFPEGTWEVVGSFGASQDDEYLFRASTLADMVGTTLYYSIYTIAARTENPSVWFVSAPDSGCSEDNLAPEPPLGLAGEQSYQPGGLQLTWDQNTEDDLWYYAVYRGTGGTPSQTAAELIATPQTVEYFDGSWSWDEDYWYIVTAVDIHGNESGLAVLTYNEVTGDDPMPVPEATFLSQNYPNPFNPATTIAFGLKEAGFVNLSVYDAAGRIVAVLINGSRPAGQYSASWNGKADNGSPAASGVYFYRLVTGDFVHTRKMVLLR